MKAFFSADDRQFSTYANNTLRFAQKWYFRRVAYDSHVDPVEGLTDPPKTCEEVEQGPVVVGSNIRKRLVGIKFFTAFKPEFIKTKDVRIHLHTSYYTRYKLC